MCMRPSPWEWSPARTPGSFARCSNAGAFGQPGAADVDAEEGVPVVADRRRGVGGCSLLIRAVTTTSSDADDDDHDRS